MSDKQSLGAPIGSGTQRAMISSDKSLAVEAVIGEPVSACLFPVQREDTGKFADFGLEMTEAPRPSGGNAIVCEWNSLGAKAGKICGRAGSPKAHNCERAARLPDV